MKSLSLVEGNIGCLSVMMGEGGRRRGKRRLGGGYDGIQLKQNDLKQRNK
jgi:hypothetical protein